MKNQIYEGPGSQSLFLIPVIKPLGTNLKKTLVNYLNFVLNPLAGLLRYTEFAQFPARMHLFSNLPAPKTPYN